MSESIRPRYGPIHGRPSFREHIDRGTFPAHGIDARRGLRAAAHRPDARRARDAEPRVVRDHLDGAAGREAHPRHASARTTSTTRSTRPPRWSRRPACTCSATCSTRPTPPRSSASRRSARPRRSCSACSRTSARWRNRREAAGLPTDRPNVVFGAETHVVWDKFANYFDVEMRKIPMKPDRFVHQRGRRRAADRREHDRGRRGAGHHAHRRGRPDRGDQRPPRADQGGEGLGHPAARRRGQRRVHRPVRRAGPRVGLPARAGGVDQRLRATSTGSSTRASAG